MKKYLDKKLKKIDIPPAPTYSHSSTTSILHQTGTFVKLMNLH